MATPAQVAAKSVQAVQVVRKPGNAQLSLLVTMSATVGIVYVARLGGNPGDVLTQPGQMLRIAIGGGVVLVILLVISDAAPDLAKALGWLILLGTTIGYGSSVGLVAANLISAGIGHVPTAAAGTAVREPGTAGGRINAGPALRTTSPTSPLSGSPRIGPRSAWNLLTGQP